MEYRIIKSKSYKRFFFSYICVLIVPVIVLSIVYQMSKNILRQNEVDNKLFTLSYIRDILDKNLEQIDSSIHDLSFNPKLIQLLYYGRPMTGSPDMYWFYEYFTSFNNQISTNSAFENSIHIYMKKSEVVLSRYQMTFGFKDYYENYVNYEAKDYDTWYKLFMEERNYKFCVPEEKMTLYGAKGDYVTMIYSIPLLGVNQMGTIACFINTSDIEEYLKEGIKSEESSSFIIDSNKALIAGEIVNEFDIEQLDFTGRSSPYFTFKTSEGMEMLIVYSKSNFNDWIYVSQIPMREITKNINLLSQVTWWILILAAFTALAGALYFSYRNAKPLVSLYDVIVGELQAGKDKNIDIELLKGGISTLIIDKKKLQDSLIRQNSALKTIYLDKLLKGYFDDINQLNKQLAYVNAELKGNFFAVAVVKINPDENFISKNITAENDMFRFVIEQMLYNYAGANSVAHILAENEMALIISLEADTDIREKVETLLHNINDEFASQFNFQPIYGIGDPYASLEDIHFSLHEARLALNKPDSLINWYGDLPQDNNPYLYSDELEVRLVNFVKSGNWKEVSLILNSIYDELFIEDTVASSMQNLVLNHMHITLIKLNNELKYFGDLTELVEVSITHNAKLIFKTLKKHYKDICSHQLLNAKKRNTALHEKILNYINENYSDSDLCVNKLAAQFNISESYFSQFFKEQIKENFSRYLEKIRIDHSIVLLQETDLPIDEIAVKSGYNSPNSFRRAFKRVTGMPPSEYSSLYRK